MAKEFNADIYVKNLPDCYRKDKNSNNHKILLTEKYALRKLEEDSEDVYNSLDIWQATGRTLDLYGEMYNQPRDGMDDDQYRAIILLKMARDRAGSDHTSIVNALSGVLGLPPSVFCMVDSEISGNVDIEAMPYSILHDAGISVKQLWQNLKLLLGAGIGIGKLNVVHDLPESDLIIATAITHCVHYFVEVEASAKEEVKVETKTATTMMHAQYFNVEVT